MDQTFERISSRVIAWQFTGTMPDDYTVSLINQSGYTIYLNSKFLESPTLVLHKMGSHTQEAGHFDWLLSESFHGKTEFWIECSYEFHKNYRTVR
jgi:hypothetical protein